jgi:carboxylesterase
MDKTWFDTILAQEQARGVPEANRSQYMTQANTPYTVVLALHGFSANPYDVKAVADALIKQSHCDVLSLCFPGHGSQPQDMQSIQWSEWVSTAKTVYDALRDRYQQVVIYAVSMGALVALQLSAKTPPAGLICMGVMLDPVDWKLKYGGYIGALISTVMRQVLRRPMLQQRPSSNRAHVVYNEIPIESAIQLHKLIRATKPLLKRIVCPTLIIHSKTDGVGSPKGAETLYDGLGTENKALLWGEGPHTFLMEHTAETKPFFDAICTFSLSPMGYFSNAAATHDPSN